MNTPLVSVVMVVANVERFLDEAIRSILAQTFHDFEFVIVDFGSTDKTKSMVAAHAARDSRIKFHAIPACGLAEARNAAAGFAQGKYLAIMDADDVAVPDRLLWETNFMEKHPEVGVLGGAVEWIDATGRPLATWENPVTDPEIKSALLERCPLWQPTVLLRRAAFSAVGGYRPPFAPAEDYDLWLRMSENVSLANLKQVVLRYRIHPHQVSMRRRTQQTFGILAARVGAQLRREGLPDPFDPVTEITSETLAAAGVTLAQQQSELALELERWIRNMCLAGEYPTALQAAQETLHSDLKYVGRRQIADLHLIVAGLYWKQKRFWGSILAASEAVVIRPVVVGRPLKGMGRLLGLSKRAV